MAWTRSIRNSSEVEGQRKDLRLHGGPSSAIPVCIRPSISFLAARRGPSIHWVRTGSNGQHKENRHLHKKTTRLDASSVQQQCSRNLVIFARDRIYSVNMLLQVPQTHSLEHRRARAF